MGKNHGIFIQEMYICSGNSTSSSQVFSQVGDPPVLTGQPIPQGGLEVPGSAWGAKPGSLGPPLWRACLAVDL